MDVFMYICVFRNIFYVHRGHVRTHITYVHLVYSLWGSPCVCKRVYACLRLHMCIRPTSQAALGKQKAAEPSENPDAQPACQPDSAMQKGKASAEGILYDIDSDVHIVTVSVGNEQLLKTFKNRKGA